MAQAQFNGSPMVVVGGRAPANRWGSGALQEIDHLPIVDSDHQAGPHAAHRRRGRDRDGRRLHRGPLVAPRSGLRRHPDGRVLQLLDRPGLRRHARHPRLEPDGDDLAAVADRARRGHAAAADPRHRRLGRRAEEAALRFVEAPGHPHDHQRHGPRHRARRPPAARHQGPRGGHQRRRPGRGRRHAARLPARLRRLRRQGRRHAGPGRARRRLPRPGLRRTPRSPPRWPATSSSVFDGLLEPVQRGRRGDWSTWASELARRGPGDGRARRRAAHRRGRPHPPGAHLRRAGPPPRRRLGRDRRRRRLRQLRRQVRRAQAARRLARPGPLRLPRRRARRGDRGPSGPARPPRSSCCSATAPPASR